MEHPVNQAAMNGDQGVSANTTGMERLLKIMARQLIPSAAVIKANHSKRSAPPDYSGNGNQAVDTVEMASGIGQPPDLLPLPSEREMKRDGQEILRRLNEIKMAKEAARLKPSNAIRQEIPTEDPTMKARSQLQAAIPKNVSLHLEQYPLCPTSNKNTSAPASLCSYQTVTATKEAPQVGTTAVISDGHRHGSDCSNTGSMSANYEFELPEEAPIILQTQLPNGVKMPQNLWEIIYAILRDQKGEWLDVRQFHTEYARRTKKPLSTDFLWKQCGIKSYKQLFLDIPHVDVIHSPDEVMYVRLMALSMHKKNASMFDVKPRYHSVRPQTDGES